MVDKNHVGLLSVEEDAHRLLPELVICSNNQNVRPKTVPQPIKSLPLLTQARVVRVHVLRRHELGHEGGFAHP